MLKLGRTAAAALMVAAVLSLPAATLAGSLELHDGVIGSPPPPLRDIQETIWFQGFLADAVSGDPVNASYTVVARIYTQEVGGGSIWGPETHGTTPINDGWFSVELGSVVAPLPAFDSPPYYLQLTIDGEILSPRLKLASVPSAFQSLTADDGLSLPYTGTYGSAGNAFDVTNTGPNIAGHFRIDNPGSSAGALYGRHNGTGPAVVGYHYGVGSAVKGVANGDGLAGEFVGAVSVSESLVVEGVLFAKNNAVVPDTLLVVEGFWFPKDPVAGYVLRCTDGWSGEAEWGPPNVIETDIEGATTVIGTSVTQYDDCQVSLTVPGPGYIAVTSTVRVHINHTAGIEDNILLGNGTSPTSLGTSYNRVDEEIPAAYPTTGVFERTFSVHSTHEVGSSGTYTYYLTGQMASGQDASDVFWFAEMTGVYYPYPAGARGDASVDPELLRKLELDNQ